jgi:hypothetical protein
MPPTTAKFLQQLQAWLAVQAPGLVPSHLSASSCGKSGVAVGPGQGRERSRY